ncbi:relaxase/mobilization nuclease domain-containing protein [Paracoccus spongiarum]|uniref:Relaxase/mobilization nuclease domain-containing protein n=1 Tax=Paracoccus spongiarum TaxID=3064387 RepID=A0ABT9JG56_9RHOB|nr:relaxase/mobilization nuclease domain-containing protein [Paracoccus sp. 2205BS29-5]MDP5308814.1 relaxase/mobilization nuclease domain-containing protein [Paracoccus sp. 2205BS29-5]
MSFLADDDEGVTIRPHLRKVRGGGRSGGRRGSGLSGSLLNKWNFAEGSRAAVFKKIASGGTHTRHQMRRQMDYINTKAQYTFGFSDALTDERRQSEASLEAIADSWEASWQGTPKNGHTSHLLISFPPDTAPRDAAAIAEEMCERAFGSEKEFADDRWEYIAALHTDRSHPHVHVLVNNRGVENGSWFYLSNKLDAPFTYQGFRNLMVSVAQDYGVHLEATTRYERGDLQYSPSSAQWRQGRAPGQRALTDRVLGMLIDEADEWGEVAKAAKMVGNARVAEVADRMIQGIATQNPISRKEFEMALENVETPEDFEAAIQGWAERMRDKVLELPPEMQGKHFTAIGGFLDDVKQEYGVVVEVEGIAHPGPMANSLHADGDLLARRAEEYVPEGRDIDRETLATAVRMFSAGVSEDDDIRAFSGAELGDREIRDYKTSLRAVELANVDYSFEARPGAVADFWQKFDELSGDAGIDRQFAKGVFENDLLSDDQKRDVLSSAVDPERGPKISADQMFDRVQDMRGEMRANIMTPDRDYLRSFMQRLTEREYPSAAPEFANRESEREYAAALRAEFGTRGFERMAEGDYRDLQAITPNRLHQRELAASVMAMAERPEHAAKFDLSRDQIAKGYEAADEPHKARRVLSQSSTGDDFSL